jgi:flagellin-specific chaperone FliS
MSRDMSIEDKNINKFLYKKKGVQVKNDFEELIKNVNKAFDFSKLDNSIDDNKDEEKIIKNLNIDDSMYNYLGSNIILVSEKNSINNVQSSFIKSIVGNLV